MIRARSAGGFTLLELLVAMSITLLLAAVMLSATVATLNLWRRTQDAFTIDTQAKLGLDYLERDLEGALFRDDGKTWLAIDIINTTSALVNHGWLTSLTTKPTGAVSARYLGQTGNDFAFARFGLSGAWLRCLTTNVEAGASLPVAVSYQLARRPVSGSISSSNPAPVRYGFFRSAVSPDQTFSAGYDLISGYSHGTATPPAQRSAGTITNPNTMSDLLATNVVDFGVWLYVREATGELRRIFPDSASDTMHRASAAVDFPEVADVMIRVLTEEGAKLVDSLENNRPSLARPAAYASDAEWWWGVVEANSRVYVRRIILRRSQ